MNIKIAVTLIKKCNGYFIFVMKKSKNLPYLHPYQFQHLHELINLTIIGVINIFEMADDIFFFDHICLAEFSKAAEMIA